MMITQDITLFDQDIITTAQDITMFDQDIMMTWHNNAIHKQGNNKVAPYNGVCLLYNGM